ncbi:hypothetical protein [Eudoraea chungangensis]|uniref:hypothetical protein n=1 Tax=Eudoraea chungangensis TaxID=1481905 RepID=UPI0023EE0215|nr:hypothetical protein [Eudoraea chungangensis]
MKNLKKYGVQRMKKSSLRSVVGGSGAGRALGVVLGSLIRYGGGYMGGVNFVTDFARSRAMK